MARIEDTGQVERRTDGHGLRSVFRFIGHGWASLYLGWGAFGGEFEPTIFHGNLWLRPVYICRNFPATTYVVEADNWRWPVWWVLLRLYLFLAWFERNLRLTATVWGLLRCEPACMPRWGDFFLLDLVRGLRPAKKCPPP